MERRAFITATMAMLTSARASSAQQAGKARRIGVLGNTSHPAESRGSGDAAFHDGLRELRYVEGRNVTLEYRTGSAALFRLTASAKCHAPAATALRKGRPSAPHSPARARSSGAK